MCGISFSEHLDIDGNRCSARADDFGVEADHIAHRDGLFEKKGIHRDGGNSATCPAHCRDRPGNIHLGHYPATENIACRIYIRGHRHHPQHRFASAHRNTTVIAREIVSGHLLIHHYIIAQPGHC